jgi:outer membrane protein assembly factor BamE (lipoprotein component of BamABCDE complex)
MKSFRFSLLRLMALVAVLGLCLAVIRFIALNAPVGGLGTIYSRDYDEAKFHSLQIGMTKKQVEAIMGPPLKMEASSDSDQRWYYSDQRNDTANFWRRFVHFFEGKVAFIVSDYWHD